MLSGTATGVGRHHRLGQLGETHGGQRVDDPRLDLPERVADLAPLELLAGVVGRRARRDCHRAVDGLDHVGDRHLVRRPAQLVAAARALHRRRAAAPAPAAAAPWPGARAGSHSSRRFRARSTSCPTRCPRGGASPSARNPLFSTGAACGSVSEAGKSGIGPPDDAVQPGRLEIRPCESYIRSGTPTAQVGLPVSGPPRPDQGQAHQFGNRFRR